MSLNTLLLASAVLLSVVGFAWLALAMDINWKQVRGNNPLSKRGMILLRCMGGVSILASLVLCNLVDHASMAALVWVMALTFGALTVAFTLTWKPMWLRPLSLFGALK